MSDRPSPYELWVQAHGDRSRYRELMRQHGHLIDAQPGASRNLPCGWPGNRSEPLTRWEGDLGMKHTCLRVKLPEGFDGQGDLPGVGPHLQLDLSRTVDGHIALNLTPVAGASPATVDVGPALAEMLRASGWTAPTTHEGTKS